VEEDMQRRRGEVEEELRKAQQLHPSLLALLVQKYKY
jgi:hypothetical protein